MTEDPALGRQADRGQRPAREARPRAGRRPRSSSTSARRWPARPGEAARAVQFGEPIAVPPDPATLQEISRITGGTFTQTADAGRLDDVYKKLGSKVGTRHVTREITSTFAAAGLVLLLAGLGTGLRWRGRLP
jgi:hypothetical protein